MIQALLERDLLPDWLVRIGVRRLLARRIREEAMPTPEERLARLEAYAADLRRRPLAEETKAANEQHYEVPTRFYQFWLGARMKYSSCLYPTGRETLDEAEEAMLALHVTRGRFGDGQRILELGCGWGSLCLRRGSRIAGSPASRIPGPRRSTSTQRHGRAGSRT
jgi:cyclopropane-fatty-acyl-phospholipid synthase